MIRFILFLNRIINFISSIIKSRIWFIYRVKTCFPELTNTFCDIDVIITLIEKDLCLVSGCIQSVKKFSLNKVRNVYIISPNSELIRTFCNLNDCIFVDEDLISPLLTKDLLLRGIRKDRVGWIKQQLVKLNTDKLDLLERYLIIDSDTLLLKHQFFSINDIDVFKYSDEYNILYKFANKIILGQFYFSGNSYISHHQIINKKNLTEMKLFINTLHKRYWYEVLIEAAIKNFNFISEYELYAQYCINTKKYQFIKQYWFNINTRFIHYEKYKKLNRKALSISFHNYVSKDNCAPPNNSKRSKLEF